MQSHKLWAVIDRPYSRESHEVRKGSSPEKITRPTPERRPPMRSEAGLQSELNSARIRCCRRDFSCGRRYIAGTVENNGIRNGKIRMIERVEDFKSKLRL